MRFYIEVLFYCFYCLCDRSVAALLLQAFEAGQNTVNEDSLFLLDVMYLPVLRLLPVHEADRPRHDAEYCAETGEEGGGGNYILR